DFIDTNSYCNQTILPIVTGTYSPFQYQYTGPASDGQTVTFDTWDQYANWSTTVAAGAPDPCVYLNDSATAQQGPADYNSSPGECSSTGGTWVPPGESWRVDPVNGTVVPQQPYDNFVQDELANYNGCVEKSAEPYNGIFGAANPDSNEALSSAFGIKIAQYACVAIYPIAVLSWQYTGPNPN
ncbi:MAG: hypothetical protein ACYDDI_16405, partial [Candidatus Acidiferrales bacterium]